MWVITNQLFWHIVSCTSHDILVRVGHTPTIPPRCQPHKHNNHLSMFSLSHKHKCSHTFYLFSHTFFSLINIQKHTCLPLSLTFTQVLSRSHFPPSLTHTSSLCLTQFIFISLTRTFKLSLCLSLFLSHRHTDRK